MEEILLNHSGHNIVVYADDLVIIVKGKDNKLVRGCIQQARNTMGRGGRDKHEPIQIDHGNIRQETKLEGVVPLKLPSDEIQQSGEIKYLGVIIDKRLTWNQHLDRMDCGDSVDAGQMHLQKTMEVEINQNV